MEAETQTFVDGIDVYTSEIIDCEGEFYVRIKKNDKFFTGGAFVLQTDYFHFLSDRLYCIAVKDGTTHRIRIFASS